MLGFSPIKFLPSLRHWSGSCQGHCWPSFCKIKCFYPVFNLFGDLLQSISLFLEASYFLHLASEINHYLGSSVILLVFPSQLFNDFISLTAKAKVLTMAHKALFFFQSLFCLTNFVLQLSHFLHSCHFGFSVFYAQATYVPTSELLHWPLLLGCIRELLLYFLQVFTQVTLCAWASNSLCALYSTFFFRVYHHLTYYTFTFKLAIIYLCQ